jgi:cytochrome P450
MTATNSGTENRCPLQRDPERGIIFQEKDGFWWSAELNCWMISKPEVIAKILRDQNFSVHSYKFDEVASRLDVSLPRHQALRAYVALALEGEKHATVRRRFNEEISANTARALEIFERELVATIRQHFSGDAPSRFCAVKEIMRPPIRAANVVLAGLERCDFDDLETLPIFFDGGIPLGRRQQIEQLFEDLYASLPDTMSADDKYFRIAVLALNMNSLLGSISESFLTVVRRNPGTALSSMDWDRDLPATALPMIERKALADSTLFRRTIRAGHRVRLFVDVNEFDRDRGSKYSELYFAAGPHRCPGMNYSRKIWNIFVGHMRQIDRKLRIRDFSYRSNDRVFTLLDKLEIETYV